MTVVGECGVMPRWEGLKALDQQDLGHYTTTKSIIVPNL